MNCGDVRSRTSYNNKKMNKMSALKIVVTFDLGRVTTHVGHRTILTPNCGDVRSRTSYNLPSLIG